MFSTVYSLSYPQHSSIYYRNLCVTLIFIYDHCIIEVDQECILYKLNLTQLILVQAKPDSAYTRYKLNGRVSIKNGTRI